MFVKQKEIWYISWVHSNYFLFWAQSSGSIRAPRIIIRTVHTKWIKTNLVISISLGFRGAGTYVDMRTCPHHVLRQSLKNVLFRNIKTWKCSIFEFCPHQFETNMACPQYVQIRSGAPVIKNVHKTCENIVFVVVKSLHGCF